MPLPALTVEALRRHRVEQDKQRLLVGAGYRAEPDLVFAGPDGRPWFPSNFERTWRAFKTKAARAELPMRFHDLRHTHASQLLAKGVHAKIVSRASRPRLDRHHPGHLLAPAAGAAGGGRASQLEASLAVTLAEAC